MAEQGFPGEDEVAGATVSTEEKEAQLAELAAKEEAEAAKSAKAEKTPWIVAEVTKHEDGSDIFTAIIDGDNKPIEFQLQVQADGWIKDNACDGPIYASLRRGKMFRAKVVRKLEEV